MVSLQAIEDTKKHMVLKNTAKSTNWAVRLFNAWCQQRNARCEEKIPDSILLTDAYEELCHWLCVCQLVNYVRKMAANILPEVLLSIMLDYSVIS